MEKRRRKRKLKIGRIVVAIIILIILLLGVIFIINKGKKIMPFSVAKKLVDAILIPDSDNSIINHAETKAVILDFIGGEPLL